MADTAAPFYSCHIFEKTCKRRPVGPKGPRTTGTYKPRKVRLDVPIVDGPTGPLPSVWEVKQYMVIISYHVW